MRFTVGCCRVEIGFLFVAVITFSLLIDRTGVAGVGLIATAVHEGGHLLVMSLISAPPQRIKMNPFGIDIVQRQGVRGYGRDAWISLAGPAANFLLAALCCLWTKVSPSIYLENLAVANLLIGAMNILPVEPLDGGQALYCLFCSRFSADKALKAVEIVSFLVILPLGIIGFLVLLRSRYNFSLLLVSAYLMLLLLLKKGRYC